jgi:tRNA G46 methylase TrmB
LSLYSKLLHRKGALYLKHDSPEFFTWSLEQLVHEKWHIDELSFDLHSSGLDESYKIMTTYEKRWLEAGLHTQFVKATRP